MENLDLLLSDRFVEFSSKITDIYKEMKDKDEQFKSLARQYKKEKTDLEKKAKEILEEWEANKKSAALNTGDG